MSTKKRLNSVKKVCSVVDVWEMQGFTSLMSPWSLAVAVLEFEPGNRVVKDFRSVLQQKLDLQKEQEEEEEEGEGDEEEEDEEEDEEDDEEETDEEVEEEEEEEEDAAGGGEGGGGSQG